VGTITTGVLGRDSTGEEDETSDTTGVALPVESLDFESFRNMLKNSARLVCAGGGLFGGPVN